MAKKTKKRAPTRQRRKKPAIKAPVKPRELAGPGPYLQEFAPLRDSLSTVAQDVERMLETATGEEAEKLQEGLERIKDAYHCLNVIDL